MSRAGTSHTDARVQVIQSKIQGCGAQGEDAENRISADKPIELTVTFRVPNGDIVKEAPQVVVYLSEQDRKEGFEQRAILLEKRLKLQDGLVGELKAKLEAEATPAWQPNKLTLYQCTHGIAEPRSLALKVRDEAACLQIESSCGWCVGAVMGVRALSNTEH